MEVMSENGHIIKDKAAVLDKWKSSFSALYNVLDREDNAIEEIYAESDGALEIDETLNNNISVQEVRKAIFKAKSGKSLGFDGFPYEIFKNDTFVSYLHVLFNVCFNSGKISSDWGKCIVNPTPKSSTNDIRDPMSYRGISLSPTVYKLYSSVLSDTLSLWAESNEKLVDEQNGFRKKRSTVDHLSSVTNLIETRIKHKMSTFAAFIDFRKAYDSVHRGRLWRKLGSTGIHGKMHGAIKSLYDCISSCVKVQTGLKLKQV
ncbi:uncharacterized protein LOC123565496 [Mercenaria mercenaria]|uniref:uncharacterized protein LOC123565496 n=1 Tax=Mercenaria mercenaria TaxID=6596 RepID=UPI00234E5F8D|nr:uncharacterized protein LOC123565496 [Mercenaria mercenaria]